MIWSACCINSSGVSHCDLNHCKVCPATLHTMYNYSWFTLTVWYWTSNGKSPWLLTKSPLISRKINVYSCLEIVNVCNTTGWHGKRINIIIEGHSLVHSKLATGLQLLSSTHYIIQLYRQWTSLKFNNLGNSFLYSHLLWSVPQNKHPKLKVPRPALWLTLFADKAYSVLN